MRNYIFYAILAGVAWGVGGYFEKAGLHAMKMPPIVGITIRTATALFVLGILSVPHWKSIGDASSTKYWLMLIIGGGLVAGSLGMWSFYSSLSLSQNLGITLAIAFAMSPVSGTLLGMLKGTQKMDLKVTIGMIAIIFGIIMIQLAHKPSQG